MSLNKHTCPFLHRQRKLWKRVLYLFMSLSFPWFINVSLQPYKAKLGNSWVSPNVGHLILKYLCPALHEVLQDGLKAYVLDLIIGQRRCQPWSLVEASTQLGENSSARSRVLKKTNVQFLDIFVWLLHLYYPLVGRVTCPTVYLSKDDTQQFKSSDIKAVFNRIVDNFVSTN